MQKHVKNYMKYFGYGEQDIVLSELSGKMATDLHHINYRSRSGGDEAENIIALTRDEHDRAHFKKKPYLHKEELQRIHNKKLKWKS